MNMLCGISSSGSKLSKALKVKSLNTRLGQALCKAGVPFCTVDFSENERELYFCMEKAINAASLPLRQKKMLISTKKSYGRCGSAWSCLKPDAQLVICISLKRMMCRRCDDEQLARVCIAVRKFFDG